jgi:DNA invertase Pin-like site-specific DNA recombinase
MRVAAYLRVSTDAQTVANQRPEVEAFCAARGWTLVKTYEETASGAAKRRPVFDRLLEDARKRHFDGVVVWRLDRFGRSMLSNMDSVRLLDAAGVAVASVRESWLDTSAGPLRSLLIAIFSYVAEVERETLRERTKAGVAVRSLGG